MMNILITYYSKTENTEKVAYSIKEGLSGENVVIKPVAEIDPLTLHSYDLVILGSGIYASRIDKSIIQLIKKAPNLPRRFAYFCTHASLDFYQKPFDKVTKILNENECSITGEFDCIGENIGIPMEKRLEMIDQLPESERKKAKENMQKIKGRPNTEDLKKAKKFGFSLIK